MPFGSRRADLLERSLQTRSLQGAQITDQEISDLLGTVARILALNALAYAPRPEFVSELGIRLHAEALTLPVRDARTVPSAHRARRSSAGPMVFVIGRGLPRILAGATASALLVGAVVGGASRSALPGGLLYPVKALLDAAAVQLAGSNFDRGMTLLSQAEEHISDASSLVNRDGADTDPASVDQALLGAYDAVSGGQRALLGEFDQTGNPQALVALQKFTVSALPQLHALRPLVPADSQPDVDALIALLQDSRTSVARRVAVCGKPCVSRGGAGLGSSPVLAPLTLPSALPSLPTTAVTESVAGVVGPPIPAGSSGGQGLPTSGGGKVIVPAPLTGAGGTVNVSPPVVTLGPVAVNPPRIVIPPVVAPVPLVTSVTSSVTSLTSSVTSLTSHLLGLP